MFTTIKVSELLDEDAIVDLDSVDKTVALRMLCERLGGNARVVNPEAFCQAILERERLASTGVGWGIAIPHVKIPEVTDYVLAVGRSRSGIDFSAIDGKPVHLIFMIGASDRQTREFVKILAQMTHLLKSAEVRDALLQASTAAEFLNVIRENER